LFALGVALLIAKLNDYPWVRPDLREDDHYRALAGSHGVNSGNFWSLFDCDISDDFKNLIEGMVAVDPSSRPTIVDIVGHSWFRGKVDSVAQFKQKCESYFNLAQEEKSKLNSAQGVDYAVDPARRSDATFDEHTNNLSNASFRPVLERTSASNVKLFTIAGTPLVIMKHLHDAAKSIGQVTVSETKWKMTVTDLNSQKTDKDDFKIQIELHEAKPNESYAVSVFRKQSTDHKFNQFNTIYAQFKDEVFANDQN